MNYYHKKSLLCLPLRMRQAHSFPLTLSNYEFGLWKVLAQVVQVVYVLLKDRKVRTSKKVDLKEERVLYTLVNSKCPKTE